MLPGNNFTQLFPILLSTEKPEAVEPAEGQLLCKVCGDIANGVHFGVTTCEGCKVPVILFIMFMCIRCV